MDNSPEMANGTRNTATEPFPPFTQDIKFLSPCPMCSTPTITLSNNNTLPLSSLHPSPAQTLNHRSTPKTFSVLLGEKPLPTPSPLLSPLSTSLSKDKRTFLAMEAARELDKKQREEEVQGWSREAMLEAREESLKRREEMVAYREEMVREREAGVKRRSVIWQAGERVREADERDEMVRREEVSRRSWMEEEKEDGKEIEKKGSGKRWLEKILGTGNGSGSGGGRKLRKRRSAFR